MTKTVWAVFNRNGERMYQYPASECEEIAMNVLRKARKNHPEAGMRLKVITIND